MDYYSSWPSFLCMALLLALSATPFFNSTAAPTTAANGQRVPAIDGLRGFLAFGVFFGHAAQYHEYMQSGRWIDAVPSGFYNLAAQGGVAIFFMITGYLFWGRAIDEGGKLHWAELYLGRVFRIGPLYLFAVASMLAIVTVRTGFSFQSPPYDVFNEVTPWLALGFLGNGPDINGYHQTWLIVAGVFWTLAFEWQFYLSLIFTSLAARSTKTHLAFFAAAFISFAAFLPLRDNGLSQAAGTLCGALFAAGMVCASLERLGYNIRGPASAKSVVALALLASVFLTSDGAYAIAPIIGLSAAFYLIVSGADLFGLLTGVPARRLGDVSYGIYLLQGLILTTVFSFEATRTLALASPAGHWAMMLAGAFLLLAVSALTHVWIERIGIDFGRLAIPFLLLKRSAGSL